MKLQLVQKGNCDNRFSQINNETTTSNFSHANNKNYNVACVVETDSSVTDRSCTYAETSWTHSSL